MTILEIAERVQENVDDCEIVHTPPRPGDFPGKAISNERALEELGWKAETQLQRGRAQVRRVGARHAPGRPTRSPARSPRSTATTTPPARCSPAPPRAEERPPRVLVLTADIGEGHDLPARIIKADLEEEIPGAEVEIDNGLRGDGPDLVAAVVRDGSRFTFRWMPWLFDVQYWLITKFAPTRWLAHHLGYAARRPRPAAG